MATGAVTGLASEAAIARRLGMLAAAGAGTPAGTQAALTTLIRQGVTGLVSFGIAGGLSPKLEPGTLLLPPVVRSTGGDGYFVDVEWHMRLRETARAASLPVVAVGGVLGAEQIVATAEVKAKLHAESGAIAVDLESHRVAAAAARAHLPFVILRAVADPAAETLPPAALVPLTRGGWPSPAILVSIARHPAQIPALLRLAGETRRALEALRHAGELLKAGLVIL